MAMFLLLQSTTRNQLHGISRTTPFASKDPASMKVKRKIQASLGDHNYHVGFKMQLPVVDYIDRIAAKQLRTRSDILRSIIVDSLVAAGIVTTEAEKNTTQAIQT